MNMSETVSKLFTALAKAQGEVENASKSSVNPHFRSKYADLAEILNTVRPVFAANGLSVVQFPSFDGTYVSVETVVTHSSGEWMSGIISAPVSKLDAQGVGSATTYMRRYALAAAAGVAQEDDDANAAVSGKPQERPQQAQRSHVPQAKNKAKNTQRQSAAPQSEVDALTKQIEQIDSLEALGEFWMNDLTKEQRIALEPAKAARKAALEGEAA